MHKKVNLSSGVYFLVSHKVARLLCPLYRGHMEDKAVKLQIT